MKKQMKRMLAAVLAGLMLLCQVAFAEAGESGVAIDWSVRYCYAELEAQLPELEKKAAQNR